MNPDRGGNFDNLDPRGNGTHFVRAMAAELDSHACWRRGAAAACCLPHRPAPPLYGRFSGTRAQFVAACGQLPLAELHGNRSRRGDDGALLGALAVARFNLDGLQRCGGVPTGRLQSRLVQALQAREYLRLIERAETAAPSEPKAASLPAAVD